MKQEKREKGIRRKGVNLPVEKNPSNSVVIWGVNLLEHDSGPEGDVLVWAILGVLAGFVLFVLTALFRKLGI